MTIFPAIDLQDGRVVRLRQGKMTERTVYSDDPAGVASRWQAEGAQWLHVVDLDAACGVVGSKNGGALAKIRAAVSIPIQFGGGLRDLALVSRAFEIGVERVVISTMAVEEPDRLGEIVARFGSDKVAVAMDTRDGHIATRGWRSNSAVDQVALGSKMRELGIRAAIVTDIARDGMLTGVDAAALAGVARATGLRVIASGGIAGLEDLQSLASFEHDGIEGAILGQALYSGRLTLREAIQVATAAAG